MVRRMLSARSGRNRVHGRAAFRTRRTWKRCAGGTRRRSATPWRSWRPRVAAAASRSSPSPRPTPPCPRSAASRARDAYAPRRPPAGRASEDKKARLGWYEYVADADLPTVVVLEDLDETPGTGAFWGEVNTNVHKGLGALGCVTNGSFRDLDMIAPGFQIIGVVNPSHAHVHVVDFGGDVVDPRNAVLARRGGPRGPPRRGGHPGRRRARAAGGDRTHRAPREGGARHVQAQRLQHRRAARSPGEGGRDP